MSSASKRDIETRRDRLNDMRVAMLYPHNDYQRYLAQIKLKKDR